MALEVNEEPVFQRTFWQLQRVAWLLLGLLLVAAGLGLTGDMGYFARQTTGDELMSVESPRIMRRNSVNFFSFSIASNKSKTIVHFDTAFGNAFNMTSMTPQPIEAYATPSGIAYGFALTGPGAKTLRIAVISGLNGSVDYTIVVDGQMVMLSTLILP
jgi:hypothetical protein